MNATAVLFSLPWRAMADTSLLLGVSLVAGKDEGLTRGNQCPIEIHDWFVTPVQGSSATDKRGPVRVWGFVRDSEHPKRIWRSSSIVERVQSRILQTRYGTQIHLHGVIHETNARKVHMTEEALSAFREGFPATWRDILASSFQERMLETVNEAGETQIRADKENVTAPIHQERETHVTRDKVPQKGIRMRRAQKTGKKRVRVNKKARPRAVSLGEKQRRVAFVDELDDVEGDVLQTRRSLRSRQRTSRRRNMSIISGILTPESVRKSPLAASWSEAQLRAYASMRNSVPADRRDYWDVVANGVPGKSTDDCRRLWESSWASPTGRQKGDNTLPPSIALLDARKFTVSTPEIAAAVLHKPPNKRQKRTGKYRSQMRRIAAAAARDANDNDLEPQVLEPKSNLVVSEAQSTPSVPTQGLAAGTPGTLVREKRKNIDAAVAVETPEILARGRSFGLQEADQYISLFKRRASHAAEGKPSTQQGPQEGVGAAGLKEMTPRLAQSDRRRLSVNDDASELNHISSGERNISDHATDSEEPDVFF